MCTPEAPEEGATHAHYAAHHRRRASRMQRCRRCGRGALGHATLDKEHLALVRLRRGGLVLDGSMELGPHTVRGKQPPALRRE